MYNLDKGQKIDIELEKYVAPVPKKSMTMKERIDKAKTKLSEKKPQETEFYGREILEAIQLTNKFPTPKKVLKSIDRYVRRNDT
ncbi:hypothetical protein [Lactococcus lactis]|uniref:hypothetical protein n=1 Tax=Lactococcus lactis TaxID=1358 RepID=UPI0007287FE1|nr:hypothetical protein [Lactococcus lactis]KST91412.1 hypothetical protein LKF24_1814 [Lactococcus lactis subsp. lactis]